MYLSILDQGIENLPDAKEIRLKVFVEEQGFTEEFDEVDDIAYHIVVYDREKPIATGRTYPIDDSTYAIGRIAVLKEYRGQQVGRTIIDKLEEKIKSLGVYDITLSSQVPAAEFYEKLGYEKIGEPYDDEHVKHIKMVKII